MHVSMNSLMRGLLGPHSAAPEQFAGKAPSLLMDELAEGFEERQGCVLPKDEHGQSLELDSVNDETSVECLTSKVNLRDFTRGTTGGRDFEEMLRMAIGYAFALKDALEDSNLPGPFRVIVGADPKGEYPSVTVRYHRRRRGQGWLGDQIEEYKDGVMAIDFG